MSARLTARFATVAPIAVLATLFGCTSSPTGTVQATGVDVTATATTVSIGATVQLQATVLPAGAPQGVTWSTSDPALATVDNNGLVLGVAPGPIVITATSTANPALSGSIALNVACPAPRVVTANPTGNTTWQNWIASKLCVDYVVATNVNMSSGILTIEPGTIIEFETGRSIRIAGSAGLIAAGTPQDQIVLSRMPTASPGDWGGVLLDNTSFTGNRLEYIYIIGAGVNTFPASVVRANLMLVGSTTTLNHAQLTLSAGYGLFMNANAKLIGGDANRYHFNARGAAYVYASVVHDILQGLTPAELLTAFANNDTPVIDVMPNTIPGTAVWHGVSVPFRILQTANRLAFQVTGSLTLNDGVRIEFEEDMGMVVRDGGKLATNGTSGSPVTLTGTVATKGHWRGIGLQDTDSRIDGTIVEYGGGAIIGLGDQEPANVQITTGDATTPTIVTITNSTFRNSEQYGMYVRSEGVSLPGFTGNTLTTNGLGAAYVDAPIVNYLTASNDYSGNSLPRLVVNTNARPLTSDATWRNLGVRYVLDGRGVGTPIFTVQNAALTIEPGIELQFDVNMGLDIRNGSLTAVGTPTGRIVFRASTTAWRGIRIFESTGTFEHVSFGTAGNSNWGGVAHPANVVIASAGQNPANVTFGAGVTSSPVSQYGLVFSFGPTTAAGCSIMSPYYVPPPDTPPMHCT